MKSYIYALLNPTDEKFVYVGKSRYPKTRFFQHLECDGNNHCKNKWIKSILTKNQFPILYIIEETTVKQEDQRESYWIKKMQKLGYRLLNLAQVESYKHVSLKEIPGDDLASVKYHKPRLRNRIKRRTQMEELPVLEYWPINQKEHPHTLKDPNRMTLEERLADIRKRIAESGRLSDWEMEQRRKANEEDFAKTCYLLSKKRERQLAEQAEKQRLYELQCENRRNFMIVFCLVGLSAILCYLYHPIVMELYKLLRK